MTKIVIKPAITPVKTTPELSSGVYATATAADPIVTPANNAGINPCFTIFAPPNNPSIAKAMHVDITGK
jgi:hypothetical protein